MVRRKFQNNNFRLHSFLWRNSPNRDQAASLLRFRDHTKTSHTWQDSSVRGIVLTTHNTHTSQTSMRLAGFETAIPAIDCQPTPYTERPPGSDPSIYVGLFKILHVIKTNRNISHYVLPHMRQFPSSDTFSLCTLKSFASCHPNKTLPTLGVRGPLQGELYLLLFTKPTS